MRSVVVVDLLFMVAPIVCGGSAFRPCFVFFSTLCTIFAITVYRKVVLTVFLLAFSLEKRAY